MSKLVSAQGMLKILAEKDKLKQKVELWLLNDAITRNNWRYVDLEGHKNLFAETPILVAYVGNKIGDGHNFEEIRNPDGTVTASFISSTAERIVGYFKNADSIRIENKDNQQWIVGTGYLWTWYAQELVAKLNKQGIDGMSISIETLVKDYYIEDNDVEVYTDYVILGTTILGDDVVPAVAGANITALNTIGIDEVKKMTLKVASLQNPQNKSKGDLTQMRKTFEENGFKVLGETKNMLALLSKEGKLCSYAIEGEDVDLSKVTDVSADVTITNSIINDDLVTVKSDEILEPIISKMNAIEQEKADLEKINADLEKDRKDLETKNAELAQQVDDLKKAELECRKAEIAQAVECRLAEIKERTGMEIECAISDEKLTEYAECDCGIENALKDIDTLCVDKMLECPKANSFVWDIEPKTKKDMSTNSVDEIMKLDLKGE